MFLLLLFGVEGSEHLKKLQDPAEMLSHNEFYLLNTQSPPGTVLGRGHRLPIFHNDIMKWVLVPT